MSNLTGTIDVGHRDGEIVPMPLAAASVFQGGACAIVLGTGYGTPLVPTTTTHLFVGVFGETYDNSGGSAGGYFTRILRTGVYRFEQTGITAASIGTRAYFSDDHTVTTTPGTTFAGVICSVDASGFAWVDIAPATLGSSFGGSDMLVLSGAADALSPHVQANYIIAATNVDAVTLTAPTATVDDGKIISVASATAHAHTVTTAGLLQTGSTHTNTATFVASAGSTLTLQAYQGYWMVMAQNAITFS